MKLPILTALILTGSTSCGGLGGHRIATDGFNFDFEGHTFERADSGSLPLGFERLEIVHRFGDVRVEAGSAPGWAWSVRVWADTPALAQALADSIRIEAVTRSSTVRLELVVPASAKRDLRGLESTLRVTTHESADLHGENVYGDTAVFGVGGSTALRTQHGDVVLEGLGAPYRGEHSHGELRATEIAEGEISFNHGDLWVRGAGALAIRSRHADGAYSAIAGDLMVDSEHGDVIVEGARVVHASGAHGRWRILDSTGLDLDHRHGDVDARLLGGEARISVSHGSLHVERVAPASAVHGPTWVRVSHGNVRVDLPHGGSAQVEVEHGDVTLVHLEDSATPVAVRVRHGEVHSDLPVSDWLRDDARSVRLLVDHGDVRVEAQPAAR